MGFKSRALLQPIEISAQAPAEAPVEIPTVSHASVPPPDLLEAIEANAAAHASWERISPSHRREFVEWIGEAKRPETRARRVSKAVHMLASK